MSKIDIDTKIKAEVRILKPTGISVSYNEEEIIVTARDASEELVVAMLKETVRRLASATGIEVIR